MTLTKCMSLIFLNVVLISSLMASEVVSTQENNSFLSKAAEKKVKNTGSFNVRLSKDKKQNSIHDILNEQPKTQAQS